MAKRVVVVVVVVEVAVVVPRSTRIGQDQTISDAKSGGVSDERL